jgi:hypothetical protein
MAGAYLGKELTMWNPRQVIVITVLGLVTALGLICMVSQVSRDLALWLILVVLVGLGVTAILAVVRWFRAPYFREIPPTAAGLFPMLTTNAAGRLVLLNPNAAPGATASVQADGQVNLGAFDPAHLLAASREGRIVQATAALAQPGGGGLGGAAAARLMMSPPAADDLPPVRVSTVAPEHVQRLLVEAGEIEE